MEEKWEKGIEVYRNRGREHRNRKKAVLLYAEG